MARCPQCGIEVEVGAKFCAECGTPVPQTKECPKCHAQLKPTAKFCAECGYSFAGLASTGGGASGVQMGSKNLISGDVVGHQESFKVCGNATIVKNIDESRQMVQCHVCGRNMTIDESFDCPICHEKTCPNCYDRAKGSCTKCHESKVKENETAYKESVVRLCVNGTIGLAERRELIALQKKLGVSTARAMELEKVARGNARGADAGLTTFEEFSIEKALFELYGKGDAKAAVEIVQPIYDAHPLEEKVVSLYAAALGAYDSDKAKAIISGIQADMLGIYLTTIDIALRSDDMAHAEARLLAAESMWPEANLLKCRRIRFLQKMSNATGDETFLAEAGNAIVELGEPQNKLERSWIFFVQNLISQAFGDSVADVTEDLCAEKDLFYPVASGKLLA